MSCENIEAVTTLANIISSVIKHEVLEKPYIRTRDNPRAEREAKRELCPVRDAQQRAHQEEELLNPGLQREIRMPRE